MYCKAPLVGSTLSDSSQEPAAVVHKYRGRLSPLGLERQWLPFPLGMLAVPPKGEPNMCLSLGSHGWPWVQCLHYRAEHTQSRNLAAKQPEEQGKAEWK